MRVIAGVAKGRRLGRARGDEVRPMTDRVRSALFSSLGAMVVDARILDLYAGSGSIGIEALSRGASSAMFVECDPQAVETIKKNLTATALGEHAEVVEAEVEEFLEHCSEKPFDLIVIDPPFRVGLASSVLDLIRERRLAAPDAVVAVQISARVARVPVLDPWRVAHEKRYGDSVLVYLKMEVL